MSGYVSGYYDSRMYQYGNGYSSQGTLKQRFMQNQASLNASGYTGAAATTAGATAGVEGNVDTSVVYSAEQEAYDKAAYDGNTCTDGKNDGKIGFFASLGNAIEGIGKSIVNGVKGMFTDAEGNFSLGKTLLSVGMVAVSFVPVVGPFIGGAMACVGVASGVMGVVNAATAAANATTDAEAKQAWENIGGGVFTAAASAVALKGSASMMKHQLNGGSHMVNAIKQGAGKEAIKAGLKQDFKGNATAAWEGTKELGRRARKKAGEYWKEPGKLWDDAVANPCRNLKNKVKNGYRNYKNGFIKKELRTVDISDEMRTIGNKTVIETADGISTHTAPDGRIYAYDKKGKLVSVSMDKNGVRYTYGANGKLKTGVSVTDNETITREFTEFGRKKSTEINRDNGTIEIEKSNLFGKTNKTETTVYKHKNSITTRTKHPDGTVVVTKTSLDGKTTFSTTTTKPNGTVIKTEGYTGAKGKPATATTKTYQIADDFTYQASSGTGKTIYRINGKVATPTTYQHWLKRGVNGYNWLMDQKALGIAGPRFGQLTTIKPGTFFYDVNPVMQNNINQAVLTGYISNRAGNR